MLYSVDDVSHKKKKKQHHRPIRVDLRKKKAKAKNVALI